LQPCHSCGAAHGQPRPLTTSCGFAASGTIPFPGANSIFSTCCGAISGRLRFRSSRAAIPATATPLFKDRRSARRFSPGRCRENKYRTATRLWQEIC
jgi:hypothetical protein